MFWIAQWWRKRQRDIDLDVLWPAIKAGASDIETAKTAFLIHAQSEPAWHDLSTHEVLSILSHR